MDLASRCWNREEGKNATAGQRCFLHVYEEHTKRSHDGSMHPCSSLVLSQMEDIML